MTDDTQDAEVRDVASRQRYELATPDGPAIAAYERRGDILVLTHTAVPPAQEGHGVASRLIAAVLADVRARDLRIVPSCPFVAAYLDRHPGERDLVAEDAAA
ncbi:GNAT family N-acetyltransferase [Sphingomonas sp.]|uniref:GNAT family N-acetyltransferase n=1 Tax=Sphingomonas sp. TaxID=28214 RepID=UPI0035BC917F